jgi:PAS domain S-box-containing protein
MKRTHHPAAQTAPNQPSLAINEAILKREETTDTVSTESILQALVENSFDLAGLLDENFRYLYVSDSVDEIFNSKSDRLFGYRTGQLLGNDCFDLVHPDDQPRLKEQVGSLLKGEKKVQLRPYRIKDTGGAWHWLEAILTNQLNNPAIRAIIVSAREVTRQVEAEQKLKEMQLMEALMEGEEKERSRIARDLHDEISGMLAAANMHAGALVNRLPQLADMEEFKQVISLLQQTAVQVRRTSHNLMPEILLENGLNAALSRYCAAISNPNLRVDYVCLGSPERFSFQFELSLYRIAQELVANVVKHASASQALVQLCRQNNSLSLTVEDDGKGFHPSTVGNGTGIQAVKKRAGMMNGQFELRSAPGSGTSIYIEFEV